MFDMVVGVFIIIFYECILCFVWVGFVEGFVDWFDSLWLVSKKW